MHEAEIVADKTDTDIYLRWSDDDFASYSHGGKSICETSGREHAGSGDIAADVWLKHLDNKPLGFEALELTIGD